MPRGKTVSLRAFDAPACPPLDVRPLARVTGRLARLPREGAAVGGALVVLWRPTLPRAGDPFRLARAAWRDGDLLEFEDADAHGAWVLHVAPAPEERY